MTEARWPLSIRDQRGHSRRGVVIFTDNVESAASGPGSFGEFAIGMLSDTAQLRSVQPGTAVCIPRRRKPHALPDPEALKLPSRLQDLRFKAPRMADYAAGRIVAVAPLRVDPAHVFPADSVHPRFTRLASLLVQAADAEARAPYTALIRRELHLPAGSDAIAVLAARLKNSDPASKLPPVAPATVRLKQSLASLREGDAPACSLEELRDDLQFVRLFDEPAAWTAEALGNLLADIESARDGERSTNRRGVARRPPRVAPVRLNSDTPSAEK